jgi:hypothetical protein
MNRACIVALAMLLVSIPLGAQTRALIRAFPRSFGAAVGVGGFKTRSTDTGRNYTYKSSLGLHGRFDTPVTRRTGLLFGAGLAPLSRQMEHNPVSTIIADRLMVGTADAALGFRFKPGAAVFFAAGGGLTHATKPPAPTTRGAVTEPHALLAIGYDGKSSEAWNIRAVLNNRWAFVADDGEAGTIEVSTARDWTVEFGFRYVFGARAPR